MFVAFGLLVSSFFRPLRPTVGPSPSRRHISTVSAGVGHNGGVPTLRVIGSPVIGAPLPGGEQGD